MRPSGHLLGDEGDVSAGAVVGDEIDLDFVLCNLGYDLGPIYDHL